MKFIVLGEDSKEYGPIDAETLKKWVENGRVMPETKVRNILLKKWNKASDFDFLQPSFAVQVEKVEQNKGFKDRLKESLTHMFRPRESRIRNPQNTAFRNKYVHDNADVFVRIGAGLMDWFLVFVYALTLFIVSCAGMQAGMDVNTIFQCYFIFLLGGTLLYFGISMGLYAQTFGMWFWGIIITRTDTGEVFLGRAYFFTVFMLVFNVADLFITYLNPAKRSIHEIISGTMLIRTAAKPKA